MIDVRNNRIVNLAFKHLINFRLNFFTLFQWYFNIFICNDFSIKAFFYN